MNRFGKVLSATVGVSVIAVSSVWFIAVPEIGAAGVTRPAYEGLPAPTSRVCPPFGAIFSGDYLSSMGLVNVEVPAAWLNSLTIGSVTCDVTGNIKTGSQAIMGIALRLVYAQRLTSTVTVYIPSVANPGPQFGLEKSTALAELEKQGLVAGQSGRVVTDRISSTVYLFEGLSGSEMDQLLAASDTSAGMSSLGNMAWMPAGPTSDTAPIKIGQ